MDGGESYEGLKAQEIVEVVREIRERVRSRYPGGSAGSVALPDLLPVLHARDAALAKAASIGSVNPRPPGLVNTVVQTVKRTVARLLDWHVRDQIEFNRSVVSALDALLESLNENNRALVRLAGLERAAAEAAKEADAALRAEISAQWRGELEAFRDQVSHLSDDLRRLEDVIVHVENAQQSLRQDSQSVAADLKDIRTHWAGWREEWEKKLSINEVQFLRSVADLEAGFQHRATMMEANFRDLTRSQHKDFTLALERAGVEIQERLWADLEKIRVDYERLIHAELRLIRQRAASAPAEAPPAASLAPEPALDWLWFAERFRGSADYVREKQRFYIPFFEKCEQVVDLGCGRGEFLELMKEAGVAARGVDLSAECVELCRSKGLDAGKADLFVFLDGLADRSMDGIFSAQVVEHLPPERIPELIRLAASKLARGGLLAIETPNPECLAALAMHFFQDPTHKRPVPSSLLRFYMEEFGFGGIRIQPLAPAVETMPPLASLPTDFREAFFGGLDYAILGRKL